MSNYMLRAITDNDQSCLTIPDSDYLPRKGETECDRISRCYGVEFALDVLEDGVVSDGMTDTLLTITGYVFDTADPMFDSRHVGQIEITKTFRSRDLPATRVRWASLGRSIETVKVIN